MTALRRFSSISPNSAEGRLLSAGRAESPEAAALQRAAARLGLPAVTVGVATIAATASIAASGQAAGASASAAVSTASASAAVSTASAATALPSTVSSLLSITFLKATVLGISLGAGALGAADLASRSQESTASAPVPRGHAISVQNVTRPRLDAAPSARAVLSAASAPVASTEVLRNLPEPPKRVPVARSAAPVSTPTQAAADPEQQNRDPQAGSEPKSHLASEVESLDRARAAVSRGNAAEALRELDEFQTRQPYRLLAKEVLLVRIEALLALGHRSEAGLIARRLLDSGAPAPQRARLERLAASH